MGWALLRRFTVVVCGVSYNVSLVQELDSMELSRLLWPHQYLYSFMVTVIKAICLQQDGAWVLRVQEQSSKVSVT